MLRKCAALLVFIAVHVTAALDQNMFPCHRDLCRRGEQYCVDDTQKCYHCADVVHLCNTTELSRDCDGYCYRVQLQTVTKLEADTSRHLAEMSTDLAKEQRRHVNMTQTVQQLTRDVSTLTTININFTAIVNKSKTLESKYEDTIQQKRQLETIVFSACAACGVLVLVVITLSGIICVTRAQIHRCSQSTTSGHLGSHEDEGHDDLPLLGTDSQRTHQHKTQCPTKVPCFTINGDVTVSRLEVQSPNIESVSNNTPPSVLQKRVDNKDCTVDMNVASIGGSYTDVVDKGKRERTPSILKNIQPTDEGLEGIKHYTLENNGTFFTDVPG
ncbi:uncharacterized protein LOC124114664 [Haliotis rufescens]|uniref:uncharacterized protein LOC124114664 n=1 Tax=Haliotis rufescens TaxID=6454 RepID=UPI00201F7E29|nr:uncharacterized protein LOC124114664 [Haliotis rufescens]XP_046331300.2 uncharacterized protein LOC124114664 [Haliotis rufescens]